MSLTSAGKIDDEPRQFVPKAFELGNRTINVSNSGVCQMCDLVCSS
jgi:hypothetical protein